MRQLSPSFREKLLTSTTFKRERICHCLRSTRSAASVLSFSWMSPPLHGSISTPLSLTHPPTMLWTRSLNYVFSKDSDFQDSLKTPQAKQAASTLRVRRERSNGTAEEPAKKLATGVESGVLRRC
jgi:hypothetical protein